MRTAYFTTALCAATAFAAPAKHRRSDVQESPVAEVGIFDEVLTHVEDILSSPESSESKVQDILNVIITDIEARDEKREDPLEAALEYVEEVLNGDGDVEDKVDDILDKLVGVVDDANLVDKRDLLAGLDLSVLDHLDLAGLLDGLTALLESLEDEVSSLNTTLSAKVEDLLDQLDSVNVQVQSVKISTKRDLLGLDLDTIDDLDLSGLIDDLECIVSKVAKATIKELRHVDPSLESSLHVLLDGIKSVVDEVEDAAGL